MSSLPVVPWIIGGLLVVVALRGFAPILAALLGLGLGVGAGVWGYQVYASGGAVSLVTLPLPRVAFGVIIAVWIVTEGVGLTRAIQARLRPPPTDELVP